MKGIIKKGASAKCATLSIVARSATSGRKSRRSLLPGGLLDLNFYEKLVEGEDAIRQISIK